MTFVILSRLIFTQPVHVIAYREVDGLHIVPRRKACPMLFGLTYLRGLSGWGKGGLMGWYCLNQLPSVMPFGVYPGRCGLVGSGDAGSEIEKMNRSSVIGARQKGSRFDR